MSNHLHSRWPYWMDALTLAVGVETLLGLPRGWVAAATWSPASELGVWLDLHLDPPSQERPSGNLFFSMGCAADGQRSTTTTDRPFWRTVLFRLHDAVGGSSRNEYDDDPVYTGPRLRRPPLDGGDLCTISSVQRLCAQQALRPYELSDLRRMADAT